MHTELLTREKLEADASNFKDIVTMPDGKEPTGWRATTYDTCVGEIITKDGVYEKDSFSLPPRGIVWLLSAEDYKIPKTVTGITTLRTTLTKKGILTLTVGIVDPGYEGPLSTALINFSGQPFPIKKGECFFRTAFFTHEPSKEAGTKITRNQYRDRLIEDCARYSESFLTIDTLATEIAPKILGLPRWQLVWGAGGALVATALALIGLIAPPVFQMADHLLIREQRIEARLIDMEKQIESLRSDAEQPNPSQLDSKAEPSSIENSDEKPD